MKPEDRRHEIKQILRDGLTWDNGEGFDLTVERIQSLVDREKVKATIGGKELADYTEARIFLFPKE